MPIYEYKCQSCGEVFESYRGITDRNDVVKCPNCGGERTERVISSCFGKNSTYGGSAFSGG